MATDLTVVNNVKWYILSLVWEFIINRFTPQRRQNRPSEQLIPLPMERFRTTFILIDILHPQKRRTVRTEDAITTVELSIEVDPNESNRHRAQLILLILCPSTLWNILRKNLDLRA